MNDIDRAVLQRHHQEIVKDVHADDDLLGDLFQKGVFGKPMIEQIQAKRTPTAKISTLLHLLPKRGPDALTKFIQSIQKDYHWLATKLTKTRHYMGLNQRRPRGLGSQQTELCIKGRDQTSTVDKDIRKIVSRFVRRNFQQDHHQAFNKNTIEQFLSEQIQLERNRYQDVLSSPCNSMDHHRGSISEASEMSDKSSSVDLKTELRLSPDYSSSTDDDHKTHSEWNNHHYSIDIVMNESRSIHGTIHHHDTKQEKDTSYDEYQQHISAFLTEVIDQCNILKEESFVFQCESKALKTESLALKKTVQDLKEESLQIRHHVTPLPDEMDIVMDERRSIRGRIHYSTDDRGKEDYQKHISAFLIEVIEQCNALKEESVMFQRETKALKKESDDLKVKVQALKHKSLRHRHRFTRVPDLEEE